MVSDTKRREVYIGKDFFVMAATVTINPLKKKGACLKKNSVGALPCDHQSDPPPIRRTRSNDNVLSTAPSPPDDSDMTPRDMALDANMGVIITYLKTLSENSPRGSELTRLLSRADAQVDNARQAVNKVYVIEQRLQQLTDKLNAFAMSTEHNSAGSSNGNAICAKYDRRNITRILATVQILETVAMTQAAAISRLEDKLDVLLEKVPALQAEVEEAREEIALISNIMTAIEEVARSPPRSPR